MSNAPDRDEPPMAVAMRWVSQITTLSLTMAVCVLGGWYLDTRMSTSPWLLIGGFVLGAIGWVVQLRQLILQAESDIPARRRGVDKK